MDKLARPDILDIYKYRRIVKIIWLNERNINMEMVGEAYGLPLITRDL